MPSDYDLRHTSYIIPPMPAAAAAAAAAESAEQEGAAVVISDLEVGARLENTRLSVESETKSSIPSDNRPPQVKEPAAPVKRKNKNMKELLQIVRKLVEMDGTDD